MSRKSKSEYIGEKRRTYETGPLKDRMSSEEFAQILIELFPTVEGVEMGL